MIDIEAIKRQLMADKKKTGVLLMVVLVGLLLWGRLLLKDRVPKVASAQPNYAASVTPVDSNSSNTTSPDESERAVVYVDLPDTLDRDLFELDPRYKEQEDTSDDPVEPQNSGQELTDNQSWRESIRKEASDLTLQSVFKGSRPGVMINGKVLNVGQKINGFTVIRILEREVIVRKRDMDFKLVLN